MHAAVTQGFGIYLDEVTGWDAEDFEDVCIMGEGEGKPVD
jgi:hypothetical protein